MIIKIIIVTVAKEHKKLMLRSVLKLSGLSGLV